MLTAQFLSAGASAVSLDRRHRDLARFNRSRFQPAFPTPDWRQEVLDDVRARTLEGELLERDRNAVRGPAAAAPADSEAFLRWLETLPAAPAQQPWLNRLAHEATWEAVRESLAQQVAVALRLEDLAALTRVHLPEPAKRPLTKLGENCTAEWLAHRLGLRARFEDATLESLALGNLMVGLVANRRYAYQAVGALTLAVRYAGHQAAPLSLAADRLALPHELRRALALKVAQDTHRAEVWTREVVAPLVLAEPASARVAVAEGALMRLTAHARWLARCLQSLDAPRDDDACLH